MKNKHFLGLAGLLALSMVLSGALWAQSYDPLLQSPTSTATNGWFTSAADDYIDPAEYSSVDVGRFFSFVAFDTGALPNPKGALGFAKQLGSVYLGLYYDGNGMGGSTKTITEETVLAATWGGSDDKDFLNITGLTIGATDFDNKLGVLIGVAGMGFRLTVHSTYDQYKGDDVYDGSNYYAEYYTGIGDIKPEIAWSMTTPLLEQGIKPNAYFGLTFYNNFQRGTQYVGGTTNGEAVTSSLNYVEPAIGLGLGGYDFYNKDDLTMGIDFNYRISFQLYNNDYSYIDAGKNKISTIKGLNTNSTLTENTQIFNEFDPSFRLAYKASDRLDFAAGLNLGLELESSTETAMQLKGGSTSGELEKHGADTSTSKFSIIPEISLGLQYKLIPDKLALNIGGIFTISRLTLTTEEGAEYTTGTKNANSDYTTKTTEFGSGNDTALSLGLTLNLTPGIALEAVTGVQSGRGVNVFGTGTDNLFTFSKILLTAKF